MHRGVVVQLGDALEQFGLSDVFSVLLELESDVGLASRSLSVPSLGGMRDGG
jgi:hypothetical protein